MGRISPAHVAGLDLVDKLFFNQILVSCVFTEELVWMKELDRDVERALTSAGVAASRRQVVKHVVLCLLEAGLADSLLSLGEAHPGRLPPLPACWTWPGCPSRLATQVTRRPPSLRSGRARADARWPGWASSSWSCC